MKNLKYRTSKLFLILLMIFFIIGCVSDPAKVDLSANHPANPGAQEAEFRTPPNPFKEDVNAMKAESTPDSMMKHKTQEESGHQHMDHNVGTKKGEEPDSDSTKKSGHGEGDNQHKGHRQ